MKKHLISILFFGSLWGIIEATLGHILHFIPATIAGSILFPIAAMILYRAYQATNSKLSLIYVGAIAAAIKSVDFLLPQLSIFKTINPMMAIMMESLVVVLVITMVMDERPVMRYLALPIASIGWRSIFVGWMAAQYAITGNLAPYIMSASAMANFVIISGLISGAMATLVLVASEHVKLRVPNLSKQPVIASITFALAIILTYVW